MILDEQPRPSKFALARELRKLAASHRIACPSAACLRHRSWRQMGGLDSFWTVSVQTPEPSGHKNKLCAERLGRGRRGGFQDAPVIALITRNDVLGAELALRARASPSAHFAPPIRARQDGHGVASCLFHIAGLDQITIHAVLDNLGNTSSTCGDYRDF